MISRHLGPIDFNAARHTCRSWYYAGRDADLLSEQLKRGGWSNGCDAPTTGLLASFLARECSLSGFWARKGLQDETSASRHRSALTESASVDLEALFRGPGGTSIEPVCTTSPCGRYFLLASGSTIYTYEFGGDRLHLISRTTCEKSVRAVAMDVSADKFAIAALLEGRIGIYIDLNERRPQSPPVSQ